MNALLDSDAAGKYADGRLDRMRSMLDGNSETMAELLRPVEPLAVLCHGDFCRNNVLFRYDEATGRPVDVIMIDPAQARYASPVIDLSFFLYMNTTDADRTVHWDNYVAAYLTGAADVCDCPPTATDVQAEMRAHGLYGYAYCSFFLPALLNTKPPDVERLTSCTDDERIELINESGTQEVDKLLASIVRHLVDHQYV